MKNNLLSLFSPSNNAFRNLNNSGYGLYFVKVEYSSGEDCDGGCEDDCCRCTRVTDECVEHIDKNVFLQHLGETIQLIHDFFPHSFSPAQYQAWHNKHTEDFLELFAALEFFDKNKYRIEIDSDPYGETIGGTFFKDETVFEETQRHILKLASLPKLSDKSEYLSAWKKSLNIQPTKNAKIIPIIPVATLKKSKKI